LDKKNQIYQKKIEFCYEEALQPENPFDVFDCFCRHLEKMMRVHTLGFGIRDSDVFFSADGKTYSSYKRMEVIYDNCLKFNLDYNQIMK
jgi:hypothetical protein